MLAATIFANPAPLPMNTSALKLPKLCMVIVLFTIDTLLATANSALELSQPINASTGNVV